MNSFGKIVRYQISCIMTKRSNRFSRLKTRILYDCHYLFLLLFMQIVCVGFILLCTNGCLKDDDLSLKHVAEFMSVDAVRVYINLM